MGGFTGRLGTAVGYQWRGKWCVRSHQPLARNPRTELQQQQRMMFKEEVLLASRMLWLLRETFGDASLGAHMTPSNYFIHNNQHAFAWDGEGLAVDWGALVLSEGPVAPVEFDAPVITEGTTLSIAFQPNPRHVRADHFDRVSLYVYCPATGGEFLTAPVYRRDRGLAVVLPASFAGHDVQLWGFVQDSVGRWSETIYIGHGPLENTDDEADGADVTPAAPASGAAVADGQAATVAGSVSDVADGTAEPAGPPDLQTQKKPS